MPFLLLMPSYNQAHYIREAVDSVLAQDDPDWELWIVDNSSDDTPKVMEQYTDPRIHFHHIPQRMDPGSCLNWMLERAQGRDFSYVHTDNNLHPTYVRIMREALVGDERSIAYCDMRVIDDDGKISGYWRRKTYDLAHLFSLIPLGVPFSATTALARDLGGFKTEDVADDVLFCTSAWGLAAFFRIRVPIMDYRVHRGSRTEDHGGEDKMFKAFLRSHTKAAGILESRGLDPRSALEQSLREFVMNLDLYAEHTWYSRLEGKEARWWSGEPRANLFWRSGFLPLPFFSEGDGGVPKVREYRGWDGSWKTPWRLRAMKREIRPLRDRFNDDAAEFKNLLVPWAHLNLNANKEEVIRLWVGKPEVFSCWGAKILSDFLGWEVRVVEQPGIPDSIRWPRAPLPSTPGTEDVFLDLSGSGEAKSGMRSLVL